MTIYFHRELLTLSISDGCLHLFNQVQKVGKKKNSKSTDCSDFLLATQPYWPFAPLYAKQILYKTNKWYGELFRVRFFGVVKNHLKTSSSITLWQVGQIYLSSIYLSIIYLVMLLSYNLYRNSILGRNSLFYSYFKNI